MRKLAEFYKMPLNNVCFFAYILYCNSIKKFDGKTGKRLYARRKNKAFGKSGKKHLKPFSV